MVSSFDYRDIQKKKMMAEKRQAKNGRIGWMNERQKGKTERMTERKPKIYKKRKK